MKFDNVKIVASVPFDANSTVPIRHNLKLTIPNEIQLKFRQSILNYSERCRREVDAYLKECGILNLMLKHN
jgi:hypothetical protein